MIGYRYIFLSILIAIGLLYSTYSSAQTYEQLLGFEHSNLFCKTSYDITTIGKGEYAISADFSWLNKKGIKKENPGLCLDLLFDVKPINSVEISAVSTDPLYKYERSHVKYILKVVDDQRDINLHVRPVLCKSNSQNNNLKQDKINNSIPGFVTFSIPAFILSPQHFSADQLPDIVMVNEAYNDDNNNNLINAGESAEITFDIPNLGVGIAHDVEVHVSISNKIDGLNYRSVTSVGDIIPGDTARVSLQISGNMELATGLAEFKIEAREKNGFHAFPLYMQIETLEYFPPEVFLADFEFSAEGSNMIRMNYPIKLKLIVQNKGKGEANGYKVKFALPASACVNLSENPDGIFDIDLLKSGEYQVVDYLFTITRAYQYETIPVEISVLDGYKNVVDTVVSVGLDESLRERITNIYAMKPAETSVQIMSFTSDVDKNIPESDFKYENKFALIIGNENYAKYQRGLESESNVLYATNDARTIKQYFNKTLGVPEGNTYLLIDATAGQMQQKINLISTRAGLVGTDAEIIVYYAGHGYPDEVSKVPYLMPVDVTATNLSSAIRLSDLTLSLSRSNAGKVIIFLDACFSGGARNQELLASRSVRIKPYSGDVPDNVLLIAASSAEQSALPYDKEYHGLFTFYMLKKLQETKGSISYGELIDYLNTEVPRQSLRVNEKEQNPDVEAGFRIKNEWEEWRLK